MWRLIMCNFLSEKTDCEKCDYSLPFQDGGGDYDDMQIRCMKLNKIVTYTRNDEKPCKLGEGKVYKAEYVVVNAT